MPASPETFSDEREQLLAYLAQQRLALRLASYGLSDEQARLTPTASVLSVGGLVKHASEVERTWLDIVLRRHHFEPSDDYGSSFRLGPDEDLAGVLAAYEQVAAEVDRAARSLPVDHPVPIPGDVPWFPKGAPDWTLRWVLLHLVEETARHAGHADIIRESIDGATAFPLMAAAENWPPSPYIKPWQPPAASAAGSTAPARPPQ